MDSKYIVGDLIKMFSKCSIDGDKSDNIYRCYFRIIDGYGTVLFFGSKEDMMRHYDIRVFDEKEVTGWRILFKPDGNRCIIELNVNK